MVSVETSRRVHPADVFLRGFGLGEGFEWGLWLAITVYWIVELNLSITELVLLGVVLEGTVILSETPTGVVADVWSRRSSLIIAQVLIGSSFAWTFLTENIWMLLASHALLGFGWTFRSGADVAWITDELAGLGPKGKEGRGGEDGPFTDNDISQLLLRRNQIGMLLSLLIGPLTILIGWWQSVRVVGLILSVGYISLAGFMAMFMTEDHFTPGRERGAGFVATLREGVGVVRDRPKLRVLIVVAALLFAGAEIFGRIGYVHLLETAGFRDVDGSGESLVVLGVVFFLTALSGIALLAATERQLEKGEGVARIAGMLLVVGAVGGALVASTSVVVFIGLGFLLQDGVQEAMFPVMEGWANKEAPSEVRATVHSLVGQTTSLSQIGGAIILGGLAEATSVQVGLGAATALIGLAALVALRTR